VLAPMRFKRAIAGASEPRSRTSQRLSSYFSESRNSSRPARAACSRRARNAGRRSRRTREVAASATRSANAGRPPVWSSSGRMSGVLGRKLGRRYSRAGRVELREVLA